MALNNQSHFNFNERASSETATLKGIIYDGRLFLKIKPVKKLFQSTLIHDVVTRGDIFALELRTGEFTVIPGTASVEFVDLGLVMEDKTYDAFVPF